MHHARSRRSPPPTLVATLLLAFAPALLAAQGPQAPPDCSASPAPSTRTVLDCATLATVDSLSQQMISSGRTPGIAVGILSGPRLVFARGYGSANLETNAPVTLETVFPIYSISKTLTAAAILQLRDGGRLSLDDRLARFIPTFPRAGEVTLRQLLSHTSGIHDHVGAGGPPSTVRRSAEELVALIGAQTPLYDFEPGTSYRYSNSNYALLARVVEAVSGRPHRDYLRDSVILKGVPSPTGMAVDRTWEVVPGRATGYSRTNLAGRFANAPLMDASYTFGGGDVRATLTDMLHWMRAFVDGRVVAKKSVEEMSTPVMLPDGRRTGGDWGAYGLGVEVAALEGHRYLGHGGGTASFNTVAHYFVDDDLVLVIFANSFQSAVQLEERIARVLFGSGKG